MKKTVCTQCGIEFDRVKQARVCSPDCNAARKKQYAYTYYRAHRTAALERQKWYYDEWRRNNPGKYYYGTEYRLYYGARDRCQKSGLEFNISVSDIKVPELCPVLKVEMIRGGRYAPSIDRIDSDKGYTPDNIQVISKLANRMKNDSTLEEQRKFAEWVNQSKP